MPPRDSPGASARQIRCLPRFCGLLACLALTHGSDGHPEPPHVGADPTFSGAADADARIRAAAEDLHRDAWVVDLHVDSLLWNPPFLREGKPKRRSSHVDLPRLRAGGLDAAVYGIVSSGLPFVGGWCLFTRWQSWPTTARRSGWKSLKYQLENLSHWAQSSDGELLRIRSDADLVRAKQEGLHAAFVGVEGAQVLEGRIERVGELAAEGVLYLGLAHLSGNAYSGSSTPGTGTGGLTPLGFQVLRELEAHHIWVDVAHLSPPAFWDVLGATRGPLLASHTGVRGTRQSWRNLDDAQLRAIAGRRGLIGIMATSQFLGGTGVRDWVAAVTYVRDLVGIDYIAIGTDMDGFVPMLRDMPDVSQLPRLTQLLLMEGFSPDEIRQVLGGNFLAMLERSPRSWSTGAPGGGTNEN